MVFENFSTNNMFVVADFDKTLTKAFINGKPAVNGPAVFRNGNYISEDYVEKSYALANKYRPFEDDESLSLQIRSEKMVEWWTGHFKLLAECGLTREVVQKASNDGQVQLREGVKEFILLLNKHNIPLLILSAGIGNVIEEHLREQQLLLDNVHIYSNMFAFDEHGQVASFSKEMVHTFNKNHANLDSIDYHKYIKDKQQCMLIGDKLSDIGMGEHFPNVEIISIGFINQKEELSQQFLEQFDIVIPGDDFLPILDDMDEILDNH